MIVSAQVADVVCLVAEELPDQLLTLVEDQQANRGFVASRRLGRGRGPVRALGRSRAAGPARHATHRHDHLLAGATGEIAVGLEAVAHLHDPPASVATPSLARLGALAVTVARSARFCGVSEPDPPILEVVLEPGALGSEHTRSGRPHAVRAHRSSPIVFEDSTDI